MCSALSLLLNGGGPCRFQWPPLAEVILHGNVSVQGHCAPGQPHHALQKGDRMESQWHCLGLGKFVASQE